MEKLSCCVCQKPKATLVCGECNESVCKNCAQFLEEGQGSFLPNPPAFLKQSTFCGPCFDLKVAPEIEAYEQTMEKAKNLPIFFNTDSKLTRNFKRKEKAFKVTDCNDRDETILRLAFLAVLGEFDALVDVDIKAEKIRNGSYQTTKYSGTAVPINMDPEKLRRY